ncbi:hypothetical protein [Bradyrhizobium sp. USDA 3650]
MPVLDPGRHHPRICQFWAHAMDDRPWGGPAPRAVAYVFADGRATEEIGGQLAGFPAFCRWTVMGPQGARPRSWWRDPAHFLSRSCPTQIRRGVQDDPIAVRARGDQTPADGLCHPG